MTLHSILWVGIVAYLTSTAPAQQAVSQGIMKPTKTAPTGKQRKQVSGKARGRKKARALPTGLLEMLRQRPITAEEARLLAGAFAHLDWSKLPTDGKGPAAAGRAARQTGKALVRLRDQVTGPSSQTPPSADPTSQAAVDVFQQMDRDRSGTVSLLEFRDRFQVSVQAFLTLDADHNGRLDATEFQQALPTEAPKVTSGSQE